MVEVVVEDFEAEFGGEVEEGEGVLRRHKVWFNNAVLREEEFGLCC